MSPDPMDTIGSQVRAYTQAAQLERQASQDVPEPERDYSPSEKEKVEARRQERIDAEAEAEAERTRQRRRSEAPMSWEAGQRLDTYA